MQIVVYEQEGVFSAPRARWMLRTFGAKDVFILDGGLPAWVEAGLPTPAGNVERPSATVRSRFDRHAVKDFAEIEQMIARHEQILDARSSGRFTGALPEPRPGINS